MPSFRDVKLQTPGMWDLFLERVVNVQGMRPCLSSICTLKLRDPLANLEPPGEAPTERTRKLDWGVPGQYVVIPVLAGCLLNLEFLTLFGLDWDWDPSHRSTFGLFSLFTSFVLCKFPSFCTLIAFSSRCLR